MGRSSPFGSDSELGPFHDHYRSIGTYINRGLFGGLVVLPEKEHEHLPRFPFPPHFEERVREVLKQLEVGPAGS